ncbi:helix-turn-helix domain-containing protein [Klebsiella michiganensis]|uniref:hypothetical protein n=1 Tax=Klebsiella michiganensis TaxID=1134687 RepID=UPI0029498744|nr:hypothetical protein [Klebsiella michiganensis]MDV5293149.1 hypothetical protein [Klebsiella michiganensis]MDV5345415.1 hypothetical protein [Klebsiella michiganensis]MDV5445870.1 hypothetical protein [Klebsiella michiganensis]
MLTIFSHNHFFKKAMRLKINDIKAVRKANLVDLCLTKYASGSCAQFHFLINSFEMKKNFVCFRVEGNIICLINKRRTAHIARVTDGIPVGEDITLTEREFQYIFIMKFTVLAKDYPELLGISPKAYSSYKRRLIEKFGFNSFHALLALSNYLHAFSLLDKFTPD